MHRKYRSLFITIFVIGLATQFNLIKAIPQPFVYWTMDKYSGTRLIPENNTDTRFQGDFSSLSSDVNQVLREGVVGNALYVSEDEFDLIERIRNDCIRDLDECAAGGLSLVFWLNIIEWNGRSFQIIFRSTTATKSLAGVYLAKGTGETLEVYMRAGGGETYECEFSVDYVWNKWSLIGLVWDIADFSISVYVNGTKLTVPTTVNSAAFKNPTVTDFVVGSSLAPSFYLDELRIFYEPIFADDMLDIFASDTGSFAPTTIGDALTTNPYTTPAASTITETTSSVPVATSNTASTAAATSTTKATTSTKATSVKATTSLATSNTATTATASTTTTTSQDPTTATTTTAISTTTTATSKPATTQTTSRTVSTTTTTVTSKATTPRPTTSTETTATTTVPTPTTPLTTIKQTTTANTSPVATPTTGATKMEVDSSAATDSRTSPNTATTRTTTSTPEEEIPFWRRITFLAIVIPAAFVIVCLLFIIICLCNKRRRGRRA